MAMRTYAIWGKNKYAGAFLALLNIVSSCSDLASPEYLTNRRTFDRL